jgi:hypothetical protein
MTDKEKLQALSIDICAIAFGFQLHAPINISDVEHELDRLIEKHGLIDICLTTQTEFDKNKVAEKINELAVNYGSRDLAVQCCLNTIEVLQQQDNVLHSISIKNEILFYEQVKNGLYDYYQKKYDGFKESEKENLIKNNVPDSILNLMKRF